MMKLRRTTEMAFQAAIAIALAEWLSSSIYVERGHWVVLTAMVLTTQTWGESVKRALERVGMTVLGGAVGTALYFHYPNINTLTLLTLVLLSIFFSIYTAKIQHLVSMFFLTCFIVFLFALISEWNLELLRARIIDTALGACIALLVGCFFFSEKTNVADVFIDYLKKLKALMTTAFNSKGQAKTLITGHSLLADFQKIKKNALSVRYELLFHRLNARDFNTLLTNIEFCTQFMVNLIDAYHWLSPHLTKGRFSNINVSLG